MKQLGAIIDTRLAAAPLTSSAALGTACQKIDGTGYNRARFTFVFGLPLAGASFDASIWNAATSGATYTVITNAALTEMTSGAASCVAIIDTAIDDDKPWLWVSGSGVQNSNWAVGCIVDLYQGINRKTATGPQQIVSV